MKFQDFIHLVNKNTVLTLDFDCQLQIKAFVGNEEYQFFNDLEVEGFWATSRGEIGVYIPALFERDAYKKYFQPLYDFRTRQGIHELCYDYLVDNE